jgi:class 3 adenylate cyclase
MPLFMDRHELPGMSAEDVARIHAVDLTVASRHDVEFLSYWFDEGLGVAFCLAKAPAAENLAAAHQESHGLVPNEIIAVSEDAVLRFLGTVRDPVDASEVTSSFRTILFTDLEGSTAMAEALGTTAFMDVLREHDVIIRQAVVAAGGREVKHTGDGIMASFDEAGNALECGLAIQQGFRARNAAGRTPELRVRVGMAAGEPVDHNNDLFGSTVNLASRICDAAEPGDVLVSDVVQTLGAPMGFSFADRRDIDVKGFADPVPVFRLLGRQAAPAERTVAPLVEPGGR